MFCFVLCCILSCYIRCSKSTLYVQDVLKVSLQRVHSHSKETVLYMQSQPAESDNKKLWKLFKLLATMFNAHFTSPKHRLLINVLFCCSVTQSHAGLLAHCCNPVTSHWSIKIIQMIYYNSELIKFLQKQNLSNSAHLISFVGKKQKSIR